MTRNRWHETEDGAGGLTLARRLPARFDIRAVTRLPPCTVSRRRLAHLVRQDIWRALRDLRGFTPVVRVVPGAQGPLVEAGGQVAGAVPRAQAQAKLAGVLEAPANRARWTGWGR